MAINKVIYGGDTLIDLTSDSVTPPKLKIGATAHSANGSIIDGELAGVYYGTAQPSSTDTKVWIDPSGDNINIKYQIYNSVTDLGLTSGSATIAGAYAALPSYSLLICDAGDFSESPNSYGIIKIAKTSDNSHGYISFFGKNEIGDYRMYINSSNVPTGTWVLTALKEQYGASDLTNKVGTFDTSATFLERSGNTVTFSFVITDTTVTTSWANLANIPASLGTGDSSKVIAGTGLSGYNPIHIRIVGNALQVRGDSNATGTNNRTVRGCLSWTI